MNATQPAAARSTVLDIHAIESRGISLIVGMGIAAYALMFTLTLV